MGVKNFQHSQTYNFKVAAKYSVSVDASLFYAHHNNVEALVTARLNNEKLLNLIRGAQEIFLCWDGIKPLQKTQTMQARSRPVLMQKTDLVSLVIKKFECALERSSVQTIYYDVNLPGEGEWKAIKFQGWRVPVSCVYVVVNDNDCFYGLIYQAPYTFGTHELRTVAGQVAAKPISIEEVDRTYEFTMPLIYPHYKFDWNYGVLDYWNDLHTKIAASMGDRAISKSAREIVSEMIMLAFIIAFGNDYVKGILTCGEKAQYALAHFVTEYSANVPTNKTGAQGKAGGKPRDRHCNFDILEFIRVIVAYCYSQKRVIEISTNESPAIVCYYYRIIWNFFYTKLLITNINGPKTFSVYSDEPYVIEFAEFSTNAALVTPEASFGRAGAANAVRKTLSEPISEGREWREACLVRDIKALRCSIRNE